jgi:hypothetical protein
VEWWGGWGGGWHPLSCHPPYHDCWVFFCRPCRLQCCFHRCRYRRCCHCCYYARGPYLCYRRHCRHCRCSSCQPPPAHFPPPRCRAECCLLALCRGCLPWSTSFSPLPPQHHHFPSCPLWCHTTVRVSCPRPLPAPKRGTSQGPVCSLLEPSPHCVHGCHRHTCVHCETHGCGWGRGGGGGLEGQSFG